MRTLLGLLLAMCCLAAAAQLREIPAEAKRGKLVHVYDMEVQIDGVPQRLSRGAQIRDAENRIVVPSAVAPDSQIRYLLDADGMVRQVWILSEREAAQQENP